MPFNNIDQPEIIPIAASLRLKKFGKSEYNKAESIHYNLK